MSNTPSNLNLTDKALFALYLSRSAAGDFSYSEVTSNHLVSMSFIAVFLLTST